ncbi:uncharacterized protein [Dysidea avara]|uniref:uncharacterized protein n=1 Tax=Dysidea avara TaxID=196820 RepID=UPI0033266A7D
MKVVVLLLCSLILLVHSCQPPDCDHPDCGTCANACCAIDFHFDIPPLTVNNAMIEYLKKGGADGRYRFTGVYDLRPYGEKDHSQFIMQGIHSTLVHHYNDTLNFLVISPNNKTTTVRAFSTSQIATAYCDEGQNYKNLVGYVKGLSQTYNVKYEMDVNFGCKVEK